MNHWRDDFQLEHSPMTGSLLEGPFPSSEGRQKWPSEARLPSEDDYETIRVIYWSTMDECLTHIDFYGYF